MSIAFWFLAPLNWIFALAIMALIVKNKSLRKKLLIASITILLIFGNQALQQFVFLKWQPAPVELQTNQNYSACIVLGGMSATDKYGKGYFKSAADRFIQAVELYHQGHVKKVVVAGGSQHKNERPEGNFISESLSKCGIPAQDIITENQSTNTFENANFTKQLLDSAGLKPPFLLVTSALHIKRASAVFEKAGVQVIPFPSHYLVIENQLSAFDYFIPQLNIFDNWFYFNKEVVGLWVYKLRNRA